MTRRTTFNQRGQSRNKTVSPKEAARGLSPVPEKKLRVILSVIMGLFVVAITLKSYETTRLIDGQTRKENVVAVGIDDANIFFTYARNLANGKGAVYNEGGERVEGFSSPLFALLCTGILFFTSQIEFVVLLINTILLIGVLIAVQNFMHSTVCLPSGEAATSADHELQVTDRQVALVNWSASVLLWAWIVGSPQFVIWTTITLMDVGLWTFVFVMGSLAVVKATARMPERISQDRSVMAWIVLMSLTRSEGMYFCLVWILVLGWARWRRHDPSLFSMNDRFRSILGPLLAYLVVNACLVGLRYLYFGYPLPNTFYAKVSPELIYNLKLGVGYARLFVVSQPWVIPFTLAGAWLAVQSLRGQSYRVSGSRYVTERRFANGTLAMICLAALACPILTGGDHFAYARFFQPMWPLLGILGISMYRTLSLRPWMLSLLSSNRTVLLTMLLVGTLIFAQKQPTWSGLLQSHGQNTQMRLEFVLANRGRELGILLNGFTAHLKKPGGRSEAYPQPVSLGTLTTGGVGYTYTGEKIDLLGLNNVTMAHSQGDRHGNKNHAAFDKDLFFELAPDIFAAKKTPTVPVHVRDLFPFPDSFWQDSLRQLDSDPRFNEFYVPVAIHLYIQDEVSKKLSVPIITAWLRREFLEPLQRTTSSYSIEVIR